MASNTECLIIVLDVRSSSSEEFKLKSVKCASEILKDKIVSGKKDLVSFVLVGCERGEKNFQNVVQYSDKVQLCTWNLLLKFFNFINEDPSDDGNWLDGISIAMTMLEEAQALKCARQRILLLFDFNSIKQEYEAYDRVTNSLLQENIELIVGTLNIAYTDNPMTSLPQAIFETSRKASAFELENQKHALQLVSNCNAILCNFKQALATVFKVSNRRPWVWNAKLHIGTVITISLQGIIAMKNESHLKLKKVWGEDEEDVKREERFFIKGTEVTPLPEDLVDGYMLGGTPVPYDETLVELPPPHPPGLHFIGFVKRKNISDAYFCGDSLYMLVHQKNNDTSAKKLDALVRALLLQESVVLCWKIFSAKFNTPRLVVLMPQESTETRPATMYMIEMSYHAQHQFWDFPALRTEKTVCNKDQLQAVDNLIDSMDLECTLKNTQQPRNQPQNDLLPFDGLPSIFEQNVMDVLERKAIEQKKNDSEYFERILKDKNLVDKFWCVPEPIEVKSKLAATALKKLFPLELSHAWLEKLKAKELEENAPPSIKQEKPIEPEPAGVLIDCVSLITPSEDYKKLMQQVRSISDSTARDVKFESLASQVRVVFITLLERNKLDLQQLNDVLSQYRSNSLEFSCFEEYNQFADQIKEKAIERNLREFWDNVVVEHQLGPIILGNPTDEDQQSLKEFYTFTNMGE